MPVDCQVSEVSLNLIFSHILRMALIMEEDRFANTAYDDEAWSEINIPLDTPNSALTQYVELATKPLFEVFGGYNPGPTIIEELTRKILERRY